MGGRLVIRHDVTVENDHAWCTNGIKRHWSYTGPDPVSEAYMHISHALRSAKCSCEPGLYGVIDRNCPIHRSADAR